MEKINLLKKSYKEAYLNEIPNKETIEAMQEEEYVTFATADDMIREALGNPNWQRSH